MMERTPATVILPLEIAARAICRVETIGYPDTPAGRARAQAYVEQHWRAVWEGIADVR